MPPKLSVLQFHRITSMALRVIQNAKPTVDKLANLPPSQAKGQAEYLSACLTAEYEEFKTSVAPYLAYENIGEGLTEETLQETVAEVKREFLSLNSIVAGFLSVLPLASSTQVGDPSVTASCGLNASNIVLPKLELSKFSGDYLEFDSFIARFETLVNQSPFLSVCQKFEYLLGHLDGPALSIVSHFPFTESSYASALKLLKERYSNVRRTISLHSNHLLNLPKLVDDVEPLRSFLDLHEVHFSSLTNLLKPKKIHVQDALYVHYVLSKFPQNLRDKFERSVSEVECPSIEQVLSFLTSHVKALENAVLGTDSSRSSTPSSMKSFSSNKSSNKRKVGSDKSVSKSCTALSTSVAQGCFICGSNEHRVLKCDQLLKLVPRERFHLVKSKGLCVRCLRSKHKGKCETLSHCNDCGSAGHHTLLHFPPEQVVALPPNGNEVAVNPRPCAGSYTCNKITSPSGGTCILMATALVRVQMSPNNYVIARAILDSASQASFISEHIAQVLGCKRYSDNSIITGIGCSSTGSNGQCLLSVCDIRGKVIVPSQPFLILPKLSHETPREPVSPSLMERIRSFVLADPTLGTPSPVDILLGADVVAAALHGPVVPLGDDLPVAMPSAFGTVLLGKAPSSACGGMTQTCHDNQTLLSLQGCSGGPIISLATSTLDDLNNLVHKFWAVEEPPNVSKLSTDQLKCAQHFEETTTRLPSGRFQVRLPFINDGRQLLGNSYDCALSRLRSLERKFKNDSNFKKLYADFMRDYLAKGHMEPVHDLSIPRYYIPHHGVHKTHGDTSKLRVVFDASAKSTNTNSLNSVLLDAPNELALLADVLALFRLNPYVFTCDIEQMYRQIVVHPEDRPFQCILWREDESLEVSVYALSTVTYGVGPAAYLAIATLKKLALDEASRFPKASQVLLRRAFVDDILAGDISLQDAIALRDELIALLKAGGFNLKKWLSNCEAILRDFPESDRVPVELARVLGLVWDSSADTFAFPVEEMILKGTKRMCKRLVLAQAAKLFDPSGFIAPVIMYAKCFFQRLWRSSLDWDDPLPVDLLREWNAFQGLLHNLGMVSVPRLIPSSRSLQLHGFSDASLCGYSAVLYGRTGSYSNVEVSFISCKTRVAPLRNTSIPRLELLGAHLLARLCHHHVKLLSDELSIDGVFLWTDSSIVLDWLHVQPHLLKTFVGNRVADVIDWTGVSCWRYVPGELNPADIASRGIVDASVLASVNWWQGPSFLKLEESRWPSPLPSRSHSKQDMELKSDPVTFATLLSVDLFERISSWSKILRTMSCIAFWRYRKKYKSYPDVDCREMAIILLIKYIQRCSFANDINNLLKGKCATPAIQRLAPFVDMHGVLRVKGRLCNSAVIPRPYPALLPKNHRLVALLIRHYHVGMGHAGPSQVQFQLTWNYWILSARQIIRKVIHQCVICFRASPKPTCPLMGDLPSVRVNPSPPFFHSGMDFCGPFTTKAYPLRKAPLIKSYLCIFVCMSTKAVHLEIAHDLSAQAFLDVLQRFTARRGVPRQLFSDCGTNFVGGRTILERELKSALSLNFKSPVIKNYLLENHIQFNFITPSAPHQGGLWERAVRSAKFHLKRVIGTQTLSLPQFITLAARIESILNSRPLTPLSSDVGDYSALTPAHFLIGRPLTSLLEEDLTDRKEGTLRHFQLVRAMTQHFWKQWRQEYLSTLHARSKWSTTHRNLSVGDLVIVQEPNSPPLLWPLGRVSEVIPGSDGVVRRVKVTTQSGTYERPALKVYLLPLEDTPAHA